MKNYYNNILNALVFFVLSLSLVAPSGYSYGAIGLFLMSIFVSRHIYDAKQIWRDESVIVWVAALFLMAIIWSFHTVTVDGGYIPGTLGVERPIKYILTIPVFILICIGSINKYTLSFGSAVGAIGIGILALWQIFYENKTRAAGFTNAVFFGDFALLFSAYSLIWALHIGSLFLRCIGWLGVILGLSAVILSATRASWLVFPIVFMLIIWLSSYKKENQSNYFNKYPFVQALVVAIVASLVVLGMPNVRHRIELAAKEFVEPQSVSTSTSIGLRKAFWKQAVLIGLEHPVFGVGQEGYEKAQRELVDSKKMPSKAIEFEHAHDEWLDMFAKRGLVGVIGLVLFYLMPFLVCLRKFRMSVMDDDAGPNKFDSIDSSRFSIDRPSALCGLVTVVAFFGFGLPDVIFSHSMGNTLYALLLSIWIGATIRFCDIEWMK